MEKKDQLNPEIKTENVREGYENTDHKKENKAEEKQLTQQKKPVEESKKVSVKLSDKDDVSRSSEIPDNAVASDSDESETKQADTKTLASQEDSAIGEEEKPAPKPEEEQAVDDKTLKEKKTKKTGESAVEDSKTGRSAGKEKGNKPEVVAEAEKDKTKSVDKPEEPEEEYLTETYSGLSKKELVDAIESLVKIDDIAYIRKHIGYIKVAFRRLLKEESLNDYEKKMGADAEQLTEDIEDPLVTRFNKAFERYKEIKTVYDQNFEKQKQDNLAVKKQILEELRGLIESDEELKLTYDKFRELQERWKQIGPVPQNAKNTLWNNYHFLVEKFFDKVKINKELKDLDLKKNLEAKTELCEKAEELLLEPSITKSFQNLQKLHEAWKEIGPVRKDKKDEIWERFKAATDKLNKRRSEFYKNVREEQEKNYSAKLVLCEKAEAIVELNPDTPRNWQENSEEINELFRVWKTIGFAPRNVNNEIWNRFRKALDTFFKNKKEFFKAYKELQNENYNQKVNLCMQAEALKDNDDWKKTTEQLIELQKEWKKTGPVPAKLTNKIWKRFRKACDEFFERKADYFSNINKRQEDNLKKKRELIEKIKTHKYTNDKNENLEVLKSFQRQWMEIGHVPLKEKDKLQNEFRKTVDEQFENLKISKKIKNTLAFRNRIENVKDTPNAGNIINKERTFIINKINNLQNDINLWENNIGFFASSKKADVLKSEFQNKIDNAKQELEILKEKLKILKEV